MGFEVLVTELTSAAGTIEQIVSARACYHVPLANLDAASFGQVELAEWMTTVGEDADKTLSALATRGQDIAGSLRDSATAYQHNESGVQARFSGAAQPASAR